MVNFAYGRMLARVVEGARIHAQGVYARFVSRAIGICGTVHAKASHFRISFEPVRAFAIGSVVSAVAFGVGPARASVGSTHVHANAIDARSMSRTIRIGSASDLFAFHVRVTVVSLFARAHRFVVDHSALRVRTAIARVNANVSNASLIRRTIRIRSTFSDGLNGGRGPAGTASAAGVSFGANANHGADGLGGFDFASGRSFARADGQARIFTTRIQASQFGSAIGVDPALGLGQGAAFHVRIPDKTHGAPTKRQMIPDGTFGPRRTRIVIQARIDALSVYAGSIRRAIVVASASDDKATISRIASVSAQAPAFGSASYRVTLGVETARVVYKARIDTIRVDASFSRCAIGIGSATDRVASHVGIPFVSFFARANGPVVLNEALSICSAVTRISTQSVNASFVRRTVVVRAAARRHR